MHQRSHLVELFSTFLMFESDQAGTWSTDPKLRRSMQACLAQKTIQPALPNPSQQEERSERFWATYWHLRWRQKAEPLAMAHLSAYLQEVCYWSTYRVINRLVTVKLTIADYFQIAIAEVPKILDRCQPNHVAGLKAYANTAFGNQVRDALQQQRESEVCSDWGLLLKLSAKRLKAALERAGLGSDQICRHQLIWRCFVATYPVPSAKLNKLPAPSPEMWAEMAQQYNQTYRCQLPQPEPECSPDDLKQCLSFCASQVRAYLHPTTVSLNQLRSEDSGDEWLDAVASAEGYSPLEAAIAQEEADAKQEQQAQIAHVLQATLQTLNQQSQSLLYLYYGQSLTQQQIAQQLGIQQYAVSRKLAKARETFLVALGKWSQETLHILPTSTVMSSVSMALEGWLQTYYSAPDQLFSPSKELGE